MSFDLKGQNGKILVDSVGIKMLPEPSPDGRYLFYWSGSCADGVADCQYDLTRLDMLSGTEADFGGKRGFKMVAKIAALDDNTVVAGAEFPAVGYSSSSAYAADAAGNTLWRITSGSSGEPLEPAVTNKQAEHAATAGRVLYYDGQAAKQGLSVVRAPSPVGGAIASWRVPGFVTFQPDGGNILDLDVSGDGKKVVLYAAPGGQPPIDQVGHLVLLNTEVGAWTRLPLPNPAKLKAVTINVGRSENNTTGGGYHG